MFEVIVVMCYGVDGYILINDLKLVIVMYLIKFDFNGKDVLNFIDLNG